MKVMYEYSDYREPLTLLLKSTVAFAKLMCTVTLKITSRALSLHSWSFLGVVCSHVFAEALQLNMYTFNSVFSEQLHEY